MPHLMEYDGQQCPTKINDGQRNAGLVQGSTISNIDLNLSKDYALSVPFVDPRDKCIRE